jgi:hypothetical protein
MTIFSKKSFAFRNANSTSEKDRRIKCPAQTFTYDVPEFLLKDDYFNSAVARGDVVIIDKPQNIDKVLKDPRPSRTKTKLEEKAETLGIIDGGSPQK